MSESDHLLAAIECCGARAKIAQGKLDQFTPMPSDASSERTYRKLKEDWREEPPSMPSTFGGVWGGFSGARISPRRRTSQTYYSKKHPG